MLDNENSIRIDPMNIDQIEAAIEKVRDIKTRKVMGANAFSTAQEFSIQNRAIKILHFIDDNK